MNFRLNSLIFRQVALSLLLGLPGPSFAAPVVPCNVAAGTRAKSVVVACTKGEAKVQIDAESETEVEDDDAYHLQFLGRLFSTPRTVTLVDQETKAKILTVAVAANQDVTITTPLVDHLWIIEGLGKLSLRNLKITLPGTLIIKDAIEVDSELKISANSFYSLEPFSIKKGSFSLKYEDGSIKGISFPFQSRIDGDVISVESLGTINNPTKRKAHVSGFPKEDISPPLGDLLAAYFSAFKTTLADDYPQYPTTDEASSLAFVKDSVLKPLTDNKKKGDFGESLYTSFMTRKYPEYQGLPTKVGLNSFDAVYVKRKPVTRNTTTVESILITEVKFAAGGLPHLGVRKIDGKQWRQLSLPYIESVLKDMEANPPTKPTADLIRRHRDKVLLRLVVFDPDTLKMNEYKVGDLTKSLLD